ncbi:MAG: ABC transporter substrate-binding protein [Halomonas sp.]|uniref:ABC transporter substrate-binding protein n=1 Tax=Halomonas sp. TaxID=1486246 RepID=UPI001A0E311B|nr:ABC transporter substrate-binding protein [Halomonas sp.]MBE0488987.1 ABC transporter substrate-binding protein [Halomonas sp.]
MDRERRECLAMLAGVASMAFWLPGCSLQDDLAIGIHPWPGYEPLYLAREFGWLPKGVVLQRGATAGESLAGLRRGELDGAALTLDEVLTARAEGLPLTVVLVFDDSVGADRVLARPEITSLAGLAGARIAVERSAVGSLVLNKLLEAAELSADQLEVLDLPPDRHLDAWRRGEIDAAVTYEPTATQLMREGAHSLYDSRHFPDLILDVLAVRRDRLRGRSGQLEALLAAHFLGLKHLAVNREDAMRRIGALRGLSFDEVRASYAGLELPNAVGNRGYLAPDGRLLSAAAGLNEVMVASGLLAEPDPLKGLVEDRYLPRTPRS